MHEIDANWIKVRLGGKRGAQARLAEHLGLTRDKMAKVMTGTRRLSASEALAVIDYFGESAIPGELSGVVSDLKSLDAAHLQQALQYVRFLVDQQEREEKSETVEDGADTGAQHH